MIVNKQDRKVGQQSALNYQDKLSSNMNQSEMSRYAMHSRIELGGAQITPLRAMYSQEEATPTVLPQVPKVGFASIFNKNMLD